MIGKIGDNLVFDYIEIDIKDCIRKNDDSLLKVGYDGIIRLHKGNEVYKVDITNQNSISIQNHNETITYTDGVGSNYSAFRKSIQKIINENLRIDKSLSFIEYIKAKLDK